jgi:hypothetical protein
MSGLRVRRLELGRVGLHSCEVLSMLLSLQFAVLS